ncbi:hypothetical protein [Moorena sp. SIO4G3]|uniref:hypothetical protein n=1 Tax=Moorena sp. SIO4G3 TaxID=2607821 RepID=UPI0025E8FF64|nr:hypothetical protein [Moorena sp. SIO4G3]
MYPHHRYSTLYHGFRTIYHCRKRKKYQAPVPEHPETEHEVTDSDIHGNHGSAFNASGGRRNERLSE